MKLVMDEKLKHRLVGIAVLVSIAAIFAPAVFKKSNQPEPFRVHVKLPPKPQMPDVAAHDGQEVFKTIKVTHVNLDPVPENQNASKGLQAQPIKIDPVVARAQTAKEEQTKLRGELALNHSAKTAAKRMVEVAKAQPKKPLVVTGVARSVKAKPNLRTSPVRMTKNTKPPVFTGKTVYAVQLASFSKRTNAQALVMRLQKRGYKANYVSIPSRQGTVYKVYAGHSPSRNDALRLKMQLANALQLNGFVVNTGVS